MKKLTLVVCVLAITAAFAGCSSNTASSNEASSTTVETIQTETEIQEDVAIEVPAEINAVKDRSIQVAADAAETLNGKWADDFAALVASGEEANHPMHAELTETLSQIRISSGAYYIYTMLPTEDGDYAIILDGSEEPDDYGTVYHFEVQFKEAYEDGVGAAARSAWDNGENDPVWSAFYPITNSNNEIVGIVGVDFPAPEVIDFPQWNRDSEVWNGIQE